MTTAKKKWKDFIIALLGMALVSLLCFHGTRAYLSYQTEEIPNSFSLGEGVAVELIHSENENQVFTPGMKFNKPAYVLVPEDAMETEYIAVQIYYYVEEEIPAGQEHAGDLRLVEISSGQFSRIADLWSDGRSGLKDGWVTRDGVTYYYVEPSPKGYVLKPVKAGSLNTVFDGYKIKDDYKEVYSGGIKTDATLYKRNGNSWVATKTVRKLEKGQLQSFHVKVVAYAVQGNIDTPQAVSQFRTMGLGVFPN